MTSAWSPLRVSTNISNTREPTELSIALSAPPTARRPASRGSSETSVSTRTAACTGSASARTEQARSLAPPAERTALPVMPTSGAAVRVCASATSAARSSATVGNASTTDGRAPSSAGSACSTAAVTAPAPVANPAPAIGDRTAVAIVGLSAAETTAFMTHSGIVGQDRPTFVIAPAAADLQIARREALPAEARLACQCQRALVRRLDVGLDAVQAQLAEREAQCLLHAVAHVPLPGKRPADPVAQIRVLERPADHLGELEEADDRVVLGTPRKQRVEVVGAVAFEQSPVARCVRGRIRPRPMQLDARLNQVDELAPVARRRLGETHASSHRGQGNQPSRSAASRAP